jgi:hypothetical protein
MLYHAFRLNARRDSVPVLKELNIDRETYEKWISTLPEVAYIQPAFYPHGSNTYGALDSQRRYGISGAEASLELVLSGDPLKQIQLSMRIGRSRIDPNATIIGNRNESTPFICITINFVPSLTILEIFVSVTIDIITGQIWLRQIRFSFPTCSLLQKVAL